MSSSHRTPACGAGALPHGGVCGILGQGHVTTWRTLPGFEGMRTDKINELPSVTEVR